MLSHLLGVCRVKNDIKPGTSTSEHKWTIVGTVLMAAAAVTGLIPGTVAAAITAGLIGLYNIGRVVVKASKQ